MITAAPGSRSAAPDSATIFCPSSSSIDFLSILVFDSVVEDELNLFTRLEAFVRPHRERARIAVIGDLELGERITDTVIVGVEKVHVAVEGPSLHWVRELNVELAVERDVPLTRERERERDFRRRIEDLLLGPDDFDRLQVLVFGFVRKLDLLCSQVVSTATVVLPGRADDIEPLARIPSLFGIEPKAVAARPASRDPDGGVRELDDEIARRALVLDGQVPVEVVSAELSVDDDLFVDITGRILDELPQINAVHTRRLDVGIDDIGLILRLVRVQHVLDRDDDVDARDRDEIVLVETLPVLALGAGIVAKDGVILGIHDETHVEENARDIDFLPGQETEILEAPPPTGADADGVEGHHLSLELEDVELLVFHVAVFDFTSGDDGTVVVARAHRGELVHRDPNGLHPLILCGQ